MTNVQIPLNLFYEMSIFFERLIDDFEYDPDSMELDVMTALKINQQLKQKMESHVKRLEYTDFIKGREASSS